MLLNYQEIESDSVERELGLVQQIYTQDAFLKGLFLGAHLPKNLEGFRIFKDPINLDFRILTPDYCNDEPEKWELQNLPYILDDEQGRVTSEGVYSDFNYRLAVQEKG
ncbi:hypothetical protein [Pseudoalteromonas rubra]|uniref:Uncharacterized protein n=1 Tax=Pseudoalteromonas rubra TaxID=43658 RepID=A0A0F4QTY1_9GAMM|nr:hypothetical protein [Pseudoalteromonas rubra]KJZ11171.1 hypothetical protein TW77_06575 [Pseudoalteromonas rubra]